MPQKIDASRDVVVLTSAQSAPMLITSNVGLTLNVNTTADIDTVDACTTNVTSPPSTLSLREAVCIANNVGGTDVINVPAGTYDLTSLETGELELGNGSAVNISIVGAGQTSTIIQQTDGHDRIFEQDPLFNGNTPVSISNLAIQLGTCSTGQDCGFGGGGMLGIGASGDNLTLTNVTFNDNNSEATNDGGGLDASGTGNLTVTNSTFSSNTAPSSPTTGGAAGGGIYYDVSTSSGNLTVTNSVFTSNSSTLEGGGIYVAINTGDSANISGSVFTGNSAGSNVGGGIYSSDSPVTVSNSRIVGNLATGQNSGGTGFAIEGGSAATVTDNWWGCNGGPGATGCDTVFQSSATATFNPWLVLSISASPTQVVAGGTSRLTANLPRIQTT